MEQATVVKPDLGAPPPPLQDPTAPPLQELTAPSLQDTTNLHPEEPAAPIPYGAAPPYSQEHPAPYPQGQAIVMYPQGVHGHPLPVAYQGVAYPPPQGQAMAYGPGPTVAYNHAGQTVFMAQGTSMPIQATHVYQVGPPPPPTQPNA